MIKQIKENKTSYMDLLLIADEQEDMIEKYLDRGDMFVLVEDDLKSICIVTREEDGNFELKNIATYEQYQGQGYGRRLIMHILDHYKDQGKLMFVGTGECPSIMSFYKGCGFF